MGRRILPKDIKKQFLLSFKRNHGHLSHACLSVNITPQTLWNMRKKDEAFEQAIQNEMDAMIDTAESVVNEKMEIERDVETAKWFLERKGKGRGYAKEEKLKIEQTIVVTLPESLKKAQ